jgi:hypothetical protein
MTWHQYEIEIDGRRAGVLLDHRFALGSQSAALPKLAWFGIYCRLDPGGAYWHPDETDDLDRIEDDLLRLCDLVGGGNAVYLRRLDTRGIREYYLYSASAVDLAAVLPRLQLLHPAYRIEFESRPDPAWDQYKSWLREQQRDS